MRLDVNDTIAAIATAPGPSLRGIVRVSGPETLPILDRCRQNNHLKVKWGPPSFIKLEANVAVPTKIGFGTGLDVDAEILIWPTEASFTRQASAEIHTIGSGPVLQKVLEMLFAAGCRPAEPGEFTMRAFLSGRIDLTQAEAVLGLIESRTSRQFETSLAQLAGGIGGQIQSIKAKLMHLLAELEAGLDFVEEDIEFVNSDEISKTLNSAHHQLTLALNQLIGRRSGDEQLTVVLAGQPNVGKSSLFNRLTGGEAIISEFAGTTRDYLYADIELDSNSVRLIDTAGIEDGIGEQVNDTVERQMAAHSERQIQTADVVILCIELGQSLGELENRILEWHGESVIIAITKADLGIQRSDNSDNVLISSKSGFGLDRLKSKVSELANVSRSSEIAVPATAGRIQDSLKNATESIQAALQATDLGQGEEVIAAEIRQSLEQLGLIVGTVYSDDILDLVFSRFCIGK